MSTPEAIQKYLVNKDINSLLKWVTTELVIHKPNDPVVFIHNLTKVILSQPGYEYSTENIEEMVTNAREKSDEEAKSEAESLKQQPISVNRIVSEQIKGLNEDFSVLIDSMRDIASELNPKKAAKIITKQTCKLLQCEKAILYTYDSENETIQINSEKVINKEIKFSANKGIIGRCIKNGQFEIINNVKDDEYFDYTIDKLLNIQRLNVICYPLKDFDTGEVYGIIEAINKQTNTFTQHDADLLNALGTIGQITLQNGIIYEMAATEKQKNKSMLALWSHLNDESKVFSINSLLFTITRRCLEIVDAEKCTFYFVDHNSNELWSMQGEVNIRMPLTKGMAGLCATTGDIVNEQDVYKNQKFNKTSDEKTGFVTKSMLCVPMKKGPKNKVIGVIQLINKKGIIEAFDQNDEQILELVLSAASAIVEENRFSFESKPQNKSPKKDDKFVTDLNQKVLMKKPSSMAHDIGALVEEEEESDDVEKKEEN